jgi:hypothetical protein
MLQKINNKSVRGAYFNVIVPDIHKVEYTEAGKIAVFEIEGGTGKHGQVDWLIYAQTFLTWMAPHESESISPEKRRQILENVSQSLTLLGMPHKIMDGNQ